MNLSISKSYFGITPEGIEIYVFKLNNSKGMSAEIINFGGIVRSLKVLNNKGDLEDVVLGFDNLEDYMKDGPYFGAIVGRYANRIENGRFELNGVEYELAKNNGQNHLHGGLQGFNKAVWETKIVEGENESLELFYTSKDGEEGYPGNLKVMVTYTLTEDNALKIDYFAVSDKDTVVNLTNHSYFNLSGHSSGDVLKHKVRINANYFTVSNENSIPTGEIRAVEGTPMDFTRLKTVGEDILSDYNQIVFGNGYDHNWVLNKISNGLEKAAEVVDENSKRIMEVYTTKPGIQFYTGNFLEDPIVALGKGKVKYKKHSGLCLETQYYPNSINTKNFPSPILKAGEEYKHTTIYKFSVK
jgi:aldose 1-epimerase